MSLTDIKETETREGSYFNDEYTLDAKELKKIFPELESVEDLSLIPIIDIIAREFIVDLRQNKENYSIINSLYLGKKQEPSGRRRVYGMVIGNQDDSKTVTINMHKTDVNPISGIDLLCFHNRHYWMTDELKLSGNKSQITRFSDLIGRLVQEQGLEKLTKEAKQELLDIEGHRTETGFGLHKEFYDFYFEGGARVKEDIYLN